MLPPSYSDSVRAVTFNIHHGAEGLERVAVFLQSLKPDIVFLQEVDRGCQRSGGVDQAATLARGLGHFFAFGEAFPFDGGSYGLALTSRLPLKNRHTLRLPHPSPRKDDGHGEPRIALVASTSTLTLAVTHLGLSAKERPEQARRIQSKLGHPTGLIIGGDLNEGPEGPVATKWKGWLSDAFHEGGGIEESTAPDERGVRIDAIFRTAGAPIVRHAFLGPAGYSDHRAVIVDFE